VVPGQPPIYALLPESWKEVRPYEFPGLTDEERRKMWLQARQALHTLGIPESDPAWDHVRTRPGSTVTGTSKVGAGTKRAAAAIGADRKKNLGSTSKATVVEAKDEGVRPMQTARLREDAVPISRPAKTNPKREDDDATVAPRRLPGTSGSRNAARESLPAQPQAQGPSKKAGPTDARVKRDENSKTSGRPGVITPVQSSSSRERELEREKPTNVAKKQRGNDSDLDREKAKTGPTHKVKKRKDVASDMESLRDWDGTDTGKTNIKRKKLREDYDDKDRVNGTGNTVKRRKVTDEDGPYKPGGGGNGISKARERDRNKESDRGHDKVGDRDPLPTSKRPRGSDRGSHEPSPLPRKLTVRDRDSRQREREPDRSASPPKRVKRETSPTSHVPLQRENSPLPRVSVKRTDSPPRDTIKREASPPPRGLARRDDSPLSIRNSKRGASPPRPPARKRDRDRDRESSVNGVSATRRRRSPIYTSSEDDPGAVPVRRNAPSSVTSSSSSREVGRTPAFPSHPQPPTAPYPKDREALQARYRKGYRNYIAVYHQWLEERAKIDDALSDLGREGSVFSDGDVEMMDEEGLRELADRYAAWTRELEGIRNAYSAVVERMDTAT
jgi:RNA polymerase II elongation factor ELL